VLSGRGLCDELITRPEESYRAPKYLGRFADKTPHNHPNNHVFFDYIIENCGYLVGFFCLYYSSAQKVRN
jgi:hypothetical protein